MPSRLIPHPEAEARVWAAILLGCAGAAAGEVYNALCVRGVFAPAAPALVEPVAPVKAPNAVVPRVRPARPVAKSGGAPAAAARKPAPPRVIDLAEARDLAGRNAALFVDARSALRFSSGHVPGAVSIPSGDFDAGFARAKPRLKTAGPTVVYCESADCDESDIVLEQLVKRGCSGLMHFKAGWQAWEDAGLPEEKSGAKP